MMNNASTNPEEYKKEQEEKKKQKQQIDKMGSDEKQKILHQDMDKRKRERI